MHSDEWQPIETAPKDGTKVLLYWPIWGSDCDYGDDEPVCVAYWKNLTVEEMYDTNENDPQRQKILVGGWLFSSAALLKEQTNDLDDMADALSYSIGKDGPTHWMPLPEAPNAF
jgi:hypothetical protein